MRKLKLLPLDIMSGEERESTTPPPRSPLVDGGCSPLRNPHLLSPDSPGHHGLRVPSPIITRRTRSLSTCERALQSPEEMGTVKAFSRSKGHGFITRDTNNEDIFVHISDIEGELVPRVGDRVRFRLCPIPPKVEKWQAVHVTLLEITPEVHLRWDSPPDQNNTQ
ncbi:cold shock domain-containing protein CG9705 isoform X2 [Hetaerina americana]|uniref:cold shock domain-containing protein CG9705 isoform X2 n=1 Tax=Hetaerina americana TaxID=62018 RepID=UPI003A7F212E